MHKVISLLASLQLVSLLAWECARLLDHEFSLAWALMPFWLLLGGCVMIWGVLIQGFRLITGLVK